MSNMVAYSSLLDSVIIFAGKIPYLWTFKWTLLMIYFSFYFCDQQHSNCPISMYLVYLVLSITYAGIGTFSRCQRATRQAWSLSLPRIIVIFWTGITLVFVSSTKLVIISPIRAAHQFYTLLAVVTPRTQVRIGFLHTEFCPIQARFICSCSWRQIMAKFRTDKKL